jgi:NAD(P)-dependent dehydrogenase (short-subunit alcohol dehydrogenase family)
VSNNGERHGERPIRPIDLVGNHRPPAVDFAARRLEDKVILITGESVEQAVAATISRYGRLDGGFNNAGAIGSGKPLHLTDAAIWRRVVDVNLTGVYLSMKHEIPEMLARGGGAIVNTSSTGGSMAMPGFTDYAASKCPCTDSAGARRSNTPATGSAST